MGLRTVPSSVVLTFCAGAENGLWKLGLPAGCCDLGGLADTLSALEAGAALFPMGLNGEAAGAGSDEPPRGLNGELVAGAEGSGLLPIGLKGEAAGAVSDDPPKGLKGELAAGAEGSGALPIGLKGDEDAEGAGAALGASFAGS